MTAYPCMNETAVYTAMRYYNGVLEDMSGGYERVHEYVRPILCATGVLANLAFIVVLLRPSMRNSPINVILIAIALCDMTLMGVYLVFGQVKFCSPMFLTYAFAVYTRFYAVYSVFAHSASLWLTVLMAAFRYFIIQKSEFPRLGASLESVRSSLLGSVIVVVITGILCIPNALKISNITAQDVNAMELYAQCINSPHAHHYVHNQTITFFNIGPPEWWNCTWERVAVMTIIGILFKILPCFLLTLFMALLVVVLLEARKRRQRLTQNRCRQPSTRGAQHAGGASSAERTTTMLVLIVLVFVITEFPQGIILIFSTLSVSGKAIARHLSLFSDLLSLINSGCNFALYCAMSSQFRAEFCLTFGPCCKKVTQVQRGARHTMSTFVNQRHSLAPHKKDEVEMLPNTDNGQTHGDGIKEVQSRAIGTVEEQNEEDSNECGEQDALTSKSTPV